MMRVFRFLVVVVLLLPWSAQAQPFTQGTAAQLWASGDRADTGIIRLKNADTMCWEASPAGTDVCVAVDANERLTLDSVNIPTISSTDTLTNKTISGDVATTTHAAGANFVQVLRHATDCTSITDGKSGELCFEQDADAMYVCEPTAGDCDTPAEWRTIDGLEYDVTKHGAVCDGVTDDTSALSTLAATADRTLTVPAGKFCLVSGPVTLADRTNVRCNGNSGFVVTQRVCSGGTVAGASCDTDTQCLGGGTCGGTAFAPTSGTAYPILQAASGSRYNGVRDCIFRGRGIDGYLTCSGGTNAGQPCKSTCAGGANSGKLCTADPDCPSSTCTLDTLAACTGGGTCTGPAGYPSGKMTPGSPPSSGNIRAIDLANAGASLVVNNDLQDLRQVDAVVRTGANGRIVDTRWMTYSSSTFTYNGNTYVTPPRAIAPDPTFTQTLGAFTLAGDISFMVRNTIDNWSTGTAVFSKGVTFNEISNNLIRAQNAVSRSTGIVGPGSYGRIYANTIVSTHVGIDVRGTDVWVLFNTFQLNPTCSVIATGSGVHVEHNQILVSGSLCMGAAGTDPYSVDSLHNSFRQNYAVSLGTTTVVKYQEAGNRCFGGTEVGKACTVVGDCSGGSACRKNYMAQIHIANNDVLGAVADLSGVASSSGSNANGAVNDIVITNNNALGNFTSEFGIKLPSQVRRCDGPNGNVDAACTVATCATDCGGAASCPGDCVPVIQRMRIADNHVSEYFAGKISNFSDQFGVVDGSHIWIPAASCVAGTAATNWDTPSSNAPSAACGSYTGSPAEVSGIMNFNDTTLQSMQQTLLVPRDFHKTSGLQVRMMWRAGAITGSTRWCAQVECLGVDEAFDGTFDTAACANTPAITGGANRINETLLTLTSTTEADLCDRNEIMHLRVYRDAADGGDNMSGNASLMGVRVFAFN